MEQKPKDEKLIKKRIPEEKRFIKLGDAKVDLGVLCRDPRDATDDLREAIEEDWASVRYSEWDTKLHPFAEASELVAVDRFPLDIYPPLYTNPQHICHDCFSGPCDLKQGKGKCGLGFEAYQGRLSLRLACKGARAQVMEARELLDRGEENLLGIKKIFDELSSSPMENVKSVLKTIHYHRGKNQTLAHLLRAVSDIIADFQGLMDHLRLIEKAS